MKLLKEVQGVRKHLAMTAVMKQCNKCMHYKTTVKFSHSKKGRYAIRSQCKNCYNAMNRGKCPPNKLRIQEFMHRRFRASSCTDCGCDKWQCLQNDHINSDKKRNNKGRLIRDIRAAGGMQLIIEELKKTEIVCARCHVRRTVSRRNAKRKEKLVRKGRFARRMAYTNAYKLARGCAVCNFCDENLPEALHFDHIERETKICGVAHMASRPCQYSDEVFYSEIEKCQILCANCHTLKTAAEQGWGKNVRNVSSEDADDGADCKPHTPDTPDMPLHACTVVHGVGSTGEAQKNAETCCMGERRGTEGSEDRVDEAGQQDPGVRNQTARFAYTMSTSL